MSGQERRSKLSGTPHGLPAGLTMVLWVLLVAGVVTCLLEATGPDRLRTWQIFLVHFFFWSGMAQGVLVFAATHEIFSLSSTRSRAIQEEKILTRLLQLLRVGGAYGSSGCGGTDPNGESS